MRVFYALTLPPLIHEHCLYIIDSLKNRHEFKHCKWTKPENLHITLRFHGSIEEATLNELNQQLTNVFSQTEAIPLSTRRLVLFPPKKPHILVLAIHLNKELGQLVHAVNDIHSNLGIPNEKRPFLAHTTLGRFHDVIVQDDIMLDPVKTIEEKANQIVLYQSQPTESGSFYKPLKTFYTRSD